MQEALKGGAGTAGIEPTLAERLQTRLAKMAVELMRRDSRVIDADTLARNFSEVATHGYA